MGSMYAAPVKSPLPRHLVVRVVVARRDGEDLTPADVRAARAEYPQPRPRKKAAAKRASAPGKPAAKRKTAKAAPKRKTPSRAR